MVFYLHYTRLKSYVGLGVSAWLFVRLVILAFCMVSNIFCSTLHTKLGLPHALVLELIHCICGQPLNLTKTHLLCYFHGGEHNASHNVVWDAFASIMKYARFYVNKFMSFHHLPFNIHRQVDIMLLVDDIRTLANMVIVDPTQATLVSHVSSWGWLQQWQFMQRKDCIMINTRWTCFFPLP